MKQNQVTNLATTLTLAASLGLFTACSSDIDKTAGTGGAAGLAGATSLGGTAGTGGAASTTGGSSGGSDAGMDPNCVTSNGFLCRPELKGMPLVAFVVYYTEVGESTVTASQPEPGEICLSGRVSPGGLAGLNLELAKRSLDGTKVLEPFNAAQLNITQLAFTVDSPPSEGLHVSAAAVVQMDCPNGPLDCSLPPIFGFGTIAAAGPVVMPFSDFKSDDSTQVLDTSKLAEVFIQNHQSGDYGFCIHDIEFLDAQNNPVVP
jgi:hypothetical protein